MGNYILNDKNHVSMRLIFKHEKINVKLINFHRLFSVI